MRAWVAAAIGLLCCGAVLWTVPRWICGTDHRRFYEGDRRVQLQLARHVGALGLAGIDTASVSTGSARFDGEWAVVSNQMAVLGLGQVMLTHPDTRAELLPAVDRCVHQLRRPELRAFGSRAWGEDGLDSLSGAHGHAYLGYINLALGMDRLLRRGSPHARLHDRLTRALARRLAAARTGMIETYPGEIYPPDVAAVAASIGLHGRATGVDHGPLLARWARTLRRRYIDPRSGLLVQSVDAAGRPRDAPRASGTAIAAYYLSFSNRALSHQLFRALQRQLVVVAGFGGVREYPRDATGAGDIDSGPVVLGVGVAATGFTLGTASIHGDPGAYRDLYRTASLFGQPLARGETRQFAAGGAIGNAILLAMLTAGPAAEM